MHILFMFFFSCFYRFLQSNNEHIISVEIKERIKFVCPYYGGVSDGISESDMEHYIIYRVSVQLQDYDDIVI